MDWQPIETAPTDEPIWRAIVYAASNPGGQMSVCYAWWSADDGWRDGDSGDWNDPLHDATHWMPWPTPPKIDNEKEHGTNEAP